jgi:hypothetical protein
MQIFISEGLVAAATDEEVVDVEVVVREVNDVTEGAVVELDELDWEEVAEEEDRVVAFARGCAWSTFMTPGISSSFNLWIKKFFIRS